MCLTRACVANRKSVRTKSLLSLVFVPIGIALLLAGLFFDMGTASSSSSQSPMATPNRLLEPTLPASPSQADIGAQVYWLSCLPCHGDKGQGLTDEFRAVYPPEDQNCWKSGCHGKRPYEDGFTIPTAIPAVIGHASIDKFSDAAQLHAYIRMAMPFWRPGSLTDDESWQVTAFILRENGLWQGNVELNDANAAEVKIKPMVLRQAQVQMGGGAGIWLLLIGILFIFVVVFFVLKKIRNTAKI